MNAGLNVGPQANWLPRTLTGLLLLALLAAELPLSAQADDEAPIASGAERQEQSAAQDEEGSADGEEAPAEDMPPERPAYRMPVPPPQIDLDERLRFVIRPTILGLVPLADSASFGEALVRVRSQSSESLLLHYEIKERIPHDQGIGRAEHPGQYHGSTVIRRGDIEAGGMAAGRGFSSPLFWQSGDFVSDSAVLWLSKDSLRELREGGRTAWDAGYGTGRATAPAGFDEYVAALRTAAGLAEGEAIELVLVNAEATCPCVVNGDRTALPALYARDNIGLAEYWILAEEDNPLLLKMSYLPGGPAEVMDLPHGHQLDFCGFAASGGGFAVTEINF